MTVQNNFLTLVRHEFKWSRYLNNTAGQNRPSRWVLVYVALAIIFGVGLFTYGILRGGFLPQHLWYFTFWLPWTVFGFSIHMVGREWQNQTFGWWLALPYSRTKLITAKFVAILSQASVIYSSLFTFILLLALYAHLLPGTRTGSMSTFLLWGLLFFALFIAALPFMTAVGILIGALTKSRKKAFLPLLGISLGSVWGGFFWLLAADGGENNVYASLSDAGGSVTFPHSQLLIGGIVVSWIVAWLMIVFASRLLERDLNL